MARILSAPRFVWTRCGPASTASACERLSLAPMSGYMQTFPTEAVHVIPSSGLPVPSQNQPVEAGTDGGTPIPVLNMQVPFFGEPQSFLSFGDASGVQDWFPSVTNLHLQTTVVTASPCTLQKWQRAPLPLHFGMPLASLHSACFQKMSQMYGIIGVWDPTALDASIAVSGRTLGPVAANTAIRPITSKTASTNKLIATFIISRLRRFQG